MDSVVLYAPGGGTSIQLGSWLRQDPGPDFGARDLQRFSFIDTPWSEGALAMIDVGPRHMIFPLIVGSNSAWGGLRQAETVLRAFAVPGAFLDVQPDGVPSAESVRFDILAGRYEPEYNILHNRVGVRLGALQLDTSPYGYWPTWITLASAASIGAMGTGKLAYSGAAVVGDAPGLIELTIVPTVPTQMASSGLPNPPDGFNVSALAWGNGGRASFQAGLLGGSWIVRPLFTGTYARVDGGIFTPARAMAATYVQADFAPPSVGIFVNPWSFTIPSALEPAYRGRYRVFGNFSSPSGRGFSLSIDAVTGSRMTNLLKMASAAQVGSILPTAIFAHSMIDMGDLTLPAAGSGVQAEQVLRVWAKPASWGATSPLNMIGIYLLPLDADSGYLATGLDLGLFWPAFQLRQDQGPLGLLASAPISDLRAQYFGQMPLFRASAQQLDFITFQSRGANGPSANPNLWTGSTAYAAVSIRMRPRFLFTKGL